MIDYFPIFDVTQFQGERRLRRRPHHFRQDGRHFRHKVCPYLRLVHPPQPVEQGQPQRVHGVQSQEDSAQLGRQDDSQNKSRRGEHELGREMTTTFSNCQNVVPP